jgi:sulfatase modifying factor 1
MSAKCATAVLFLASCVGPSIPDRPDLDSTGPESEGTGETATPSDDKDSGADSDSDDSAPPPELGDTYISTAVGKVIFAPPGTFTMGCLEGRDDVEGGCYADESPAHAVELTRGFWMMESEFQQQQWEALGFHNPSLFGPNREEEDCGLNCPVEVLTWWEALHAANAASTADGLDECYQFGGCTPDEVGKRRECTSVVVNSPDGHPASCEGWRLPTEAEFEYASRAGTNKPFPGEGQVSDFAWGAENSNGTSHPSCELSRNAWELCDMAGNVREWIWDGHPAPYDAGAEEDPVSPPVGDRRVTRGGSRGGTARDLRCARRVNDPHSRVSSTLGFRLVRSEL